MAGGKISNRQKMINMMYLVLTALLALNVSKEILNAFAKVENSYNSTIKALETKNQDQYTTFNTIAESVNEAKELNLIAKKVKAESKALNDLLEKTHEDILNLTGPPEVPEDLGFQVPVKMDDKDLVANYLFKPDENGEKLRLAVDKYRKYLLGLKNVQNNPSLKKEVEVLFDTEAKKLDKTSAPMQWQNYKFGEYPLIAVLTFLRQIQSDVVKVESEVVGDLLNSVGKTEFTFDTLSTMIVPVNSSLRSGEKFEADVFVTAFDSKQLPEVFYTSSFNGETPNWDNAIKLDSSEVIDGKGKLNFVASGVGEKRIAARIVITKSNGETAEYDRIIKYNVSQPTAVVSPSKMNVFYEGIPNPIEVSVPGVDTRNVKIAVSGASSKPTGKGTYDVTVSKGAKEVVVSVLANGKRVGDTKKFRVKNIPNPIALVSGKVQGKISKGLLGRTEGIRSKLQDFPFDLDFRVISFTFNLKEGEYVKPIQVKGGRFTPEMKQKIAKAKIGSDVTFTNIKSKAQGYPQIPVKSCPPIVLTVN